MQLIGGSRSMILSSNDARRDLASFAPRAVDKTRVLHFVSAFAETGAALTDEALQGRFGFDRPFFHLPNQATIRDRDPATAAKSHEAAALALPERVQRFGKAYEEIALKAIAG